MFKYDDVSKKLGLKKKTSVETNLFSVIGKNSTITLTIKM